MTAAQQPFGTWKSPISSELIVSGTIGLGGVALDSENLYWLEGRAAEGGRSVLVRRSFDGKTTDVTPPPFNVRSRVHEYGGGAVLVAEGTIYFSNFADQRIYQQTPDSEPQALTPESPKRYANAILDRQRDRLICVCEDHSDREAVNTLVGIDLKSGAVEVLVQGSDFYSSPRLSPDGTRLAWIDWNHPNMPWDGTQLWVGEIDTEGAISSPQCVAGGLEEVICAPQWSPDGWLCFASDRSNWGNLYRWHPDGGTVEALCKMEAEFGYPHWVFGIQPYLFKSATELICTYSQNGQTHLASLNIPEKTLHAIATPYTSISSPKLRGNQLFFVAGSPTEPTQLVCLDLESGDIEVLKRSSELNIDPGYLSVPEAISFPTDNGKIAHELIDYNSKI